MADVAFKDLCIDVAVGAGRPEAVARFWGFALGQDVVAHDDGDSHLAAPTNGPAERVVWINGVPERSTVKSRVHLDVRVAGGDQASLLDAGATMLRRRDDEIRWHVLRDPDGLELCVFEPDPARPDEVGPYELVVDAVDAPVIAQWWADRLGGTVRTNHDDDDVSLVGAAGFPYRDWIFGPVPEPKTTKNRVHWDVTLVDATIDDLVAAGATVLRHADESVSWTVMADPEGNEFCAFP